MKIRNKYLVRAAGWLGARFARGLVRTLRVEHGTVGPPLLPVTVLPPGPRYIFASWHEYLLLPVGRFGHPDFAVLISKHADGQILAALIGSLGMGMVLGSTNRGGIEAVRQILHDRAGRRHLAVTPDGPRGPRRVVQPGIIYAASRTGMQVVPVGVGYNRPWRAKSWDRFAVPRPGSRARLITGEPISVPPRLRAEELEPYRLAVQSEMDRLTDVAERWAETNQLELPAAPPCVS
jgi:lysophospholipid acyltransferase (LPLAT)-like uncharacterized protein